MKKYFLLAVLIVLVGFMFPVASRAVTVTAMPNPAGVNQPVTINVNAFFNSPLAAPSCTLAVDFGDDSSEVLLTPCTTSNCARTVTHSYTTPGQYTITARSLTDACLTPPTAPDPATSIVTVSCPPLAIVSPAVLLSGTAGVSYAGTLQSTGGQGPYTWAVADGNLPPGLVLSAAGLISGRPLTSGGFAFTAGVSDACPVGVQTQRQRFTLNIGCAAINFSDSVQLPSGTAGRPYSRQLQAGGGQPPLSFSMAAGSLPPGLSLSPSGLILGTPAAAGTYDFTVLVTDTCVTGTQAIQRAFSLVIGGDLRVTVSPPVSIIPRGMASTRVIGYAFVSGTTSALALTSTRGVFSAGDMVIGESATPLTATLTNGTALLSEQLNIPVAVALRAEDAGTSRIFYSRTFTDGQARIEARAELIVGTETAAAFSIQRLQLYFENQRPEITVKRNQPDLKALADIRYTGTGLLTGYWEVDGRLLEQVNRHLMPGSSITLTTPDLPALPTFSPGTHIVRFVVNSPATTMPMPQAIYYVTSEQSEKSRAIIPDLPPDQGRIPYEPQDFRWQPAPWADTYLIAFFSDNDEKPVFSAYTREAFYRLPQLVLDPLFIRDNRYRWQVKGYGADGNILGQSVVREFTFSESIPE